ncbi:MAG: hypothetical protein ACKVPX_06165 [Myxococcaceae bacterium]
MKHPLQPGTANHWISLSSEQLQQRYMLSVPNHGAAYALASLLSPDWRVQILPGAESAQMGASVLLSRVTPTQAWAREAIAALPPADISHVAQADWRQAKRAMLSNPTFRAMLAEPGDSAAPQRSTEARPQWGGKVDWTDELTTVKFIDVGLRGLAASGVQLSGGQFKYLLDGYPFIRAGGNPQVSRGVLRALVELSERFKHGIELDPWAAQDQHTVLATVIKDAKVEGWPTPELQRLVGKAFNDFLAAWSDLPAGEHKSFLAARIRDVGQRYGDEIANYGYTPANLKALSQFRPPPGSTGADTSIFDVPVGAYEVAKDLPAHLRLYATMSHSTARNTLAKQVAEALALVGGQAFPHGQVPQQLHSAISRLAEECERRRASGIAARLRALT